MQNKGTILIIDDEQDIASSLKAILENEGYIVHTANDGAVGLELIKSTDMDLIFLDLWLPNIDGLEVLTETLSIKQTPIIMMSGHAGVETIVRATKTGASDFIEKPFTASKILSLCEKYISNSIEKNAEDDIEIINNNIYLSPKSDVKINQRTIKKSVIMSGHALMSGRSTAIQLLPAPIDTGIIFVDMAKGTSIKLQPENIVNSKNASHANSTMLQNGEHTIRTTEHLLAAINMYGITNLIIKCDNEVPNVDGSALDFCNLLEDSGIEVQDAYSQVLIIDEELVYGDINDDEQTYIKISPYNGLSISLKIDFPPPIGKQSHTFIYESPSHFKNEIGCARSFNTLESIQMAQSHRIVGAGLMDSHIIIADGKILNTELRFEDEFVRHKILDIIGDLYILGVPIMGKIEANKTSHKFNHNVVIDIAKRFSN